MSPAFLAIILILISAMTHACVGALQKRSHNKLILRGILGAVSALIALPLALTLPIPPLDIWKVLALSAVVHFTYQIIQAATFTRGDMSVVYPVMRGSAPAITAFFAFLVFAESLTPIEITGLALVVLALLGFAKPAGARLLQFNAGLFLALLCGIITAVYTVVDAYGMREAPIRLAYIAWFFVIEGTVISTVVSIYHRKGLKEKLRRDYKGGIAAGLLGLVTYSSALFAFSLAPLAGLAALRETSIIFAALLATFWLKESFGRRRILLAIMMATGLVLMHVTL